ncbi:hypothetical protein AB0I81_40015 [Nonomuraea sp. NPDC050404]|uniref:hypothetical protein n=1 Tax=Nonomuraea sp. NPDC050404 TaxID=3155783 RepID=UPI00340DC392
MPEKTTPALLTPDELAEIHAAYTAWLSESALLGPHGTKALTAVPRLVAEIERHRAEIEAIARVRRFSEMVVATSIRLGAIDQARDTLAILDGKELSSTPAEQPPANLDENARVIINGELFRIIEWSPSGSHGNGREEFVMYAQRLPSE